MEISINTKLLDKTYNFKVLNKEFLSEMITYLGVNFY